MDSSLRSLYIDLNSFFASCEQQDNPELRGLPLAVVPVLADTTFVIAASYEAKAYGVKTGVRVGDARRMCPGLRLVRANHGPYVKYHHAVIAAVDTVLPVRAVCSIDEIACELTGSQRNPERATELALKVKDAIATRVGASLRCSIGVSTNFLLAKMACDMMKPDGLTLLPSAIQRERLSALKLQDVPGIGRKMEARLQAKGVVTMAQLLAKSEQECRMLWGSLVGARYHRLLRGDWIDLGDGPEEAKSIGHEHVLPPAERNFQDALMVAHKLLSKAMTRVRHGGFMTKLLTLSIRYLDGSKFTRSARVEETQDTSALLKRLNGLYATSPRDRRPIKIGVVLGDFVSENQHQLSFFGDERRHEAFKAVDAINEKFGRDTIYVGSLHDRRSSAPTRIAFSRIPGLDEVE